MADYKELLGSLVNKAKSVMDSSGVAGVYQKGADRAKVYSRIARLTLDSNNQAEELRKVFTEIGKLYFDFPAFARFSYLFSAVYSFFRL